MAKEEEKKEEKKEDLKKVDEKIEKKEPEITEDELKKSLKDLTDIIKAGRAPVVTEEEEEDEDEEELEESFTGNFEENETIAKAIEVSDFLADLVEQTETSLEAVGKLVKSLQKSEEVFDQKFVDALGNISKKFDDMDARLKKIEDTPVAAGPKTIQKSVQKIEKSFTASGKEVEGTDELAALPKRQVMALLEKAVADNKIKDSTLFAYEGSPGVFKFNSEDEEILKSYIKK
jgi:hypothetical protein